MQDIDSHVRYIALAGLVLWAREQNGDPSEQELLATLLQPKAQKDIISKLNEQFARRREPSQHSLVWHVASNRQASAALTKSVPAVKADSARSLFTVSCKELGETLQGFSSRRP